MEFVDGVCNTTLRYGYILLVFRRLHSKCLTLRQCIVKGLCAVCVCVLNIQTYVLVGELP